VLFRSLPENFAEQVITPLAAVAVCEAVERTASYKTQVKWVNDVLIDGRKVCGILAESLPGAVVLGIGININFPEEGLPEDLRKIIFSLQLNGNERKQLLDALVKEVFLCAMAEGEKADNLMSCYRSRLVAGTP
jgi:BirA family biotin operon repressor/biotin-[acetyl-CoA-carboxylase] ligase